MDKVATKRAWERAGLPTPAYRVVSQLDASLPQEPCVVKAIDSGSSIDVFVCKGSAEGVVHAADAVRRVLARHGRALVEQLIEGPELTVALLEERPLGAIRIISPHSFFDYEAKYKANDTQHRFDTGLPEPIVQKCRQLAKRAHDVVGARDLARVDIMVDQSSMKPYLLEINTLPGFTPKSLLPEAAAHAGIAFERLVDRLARRAYERHARAVA
jgi:D-alanine-D-alanine ligase